jgi:hypothetical protein
MTNPMQSDPDRLRVAVDNGVAVGGAALGAVAGAVSGAGAGGVVGGLPGISPGASTDPDRAGAIPQLGSCGIRAWRSRASHADAAGCSCRAESPAATLPTHTFRAAAAQPLSSRALRALDEQLRQLAA